MAVDKAQLQKMAPALSSATADRWLPCLNKAMTRYLISTPAQQACWLAQVLHESGNLSATVENLNYRPQVLMQLFRGHFTPGQAAALGFVPGVQKAAQQQIANTVYANRYGNGDVASGDGWKYRGRGPMQLTFKDNYHACGSALGLDLLNHPELLEQPENGALAAAWFWHAGNKFGHSLNSLADAGEYTAISKAINGGVNGLQERLNLTHDALNALGVPA